MDRFARYVEVERKRVHACVHQLDSGGPERGHRIENDVAPEWNRNEIGTNEAKVDAELELMRTVQIREVVQSFILVRNV